MKNALILSIVLSLAACGSTAPDIAPEDASPDVQAAADIVSDTDVADDNLAAFDDRVRTELDAAPMMASAVPMAGAPPESAAEDAPIDRPTETFALRNGESLAHFARWAGLPVEDLAELSELELDGQYAVGTEVKIPSDIVDIETFASLRDEYWTKKVDRYLTSRGGELTQEQVKVRTGDSAWGIAQNGHGIPIWLLEAYNPDVDLAKLRPGQKLMVPVMADIVVDADTGPAAE